MIKWLRNLFSIKCPECKKGNLIQNQAHLTRNNQLVEVYECDKCNSLFI